MNKPSDATPKQGEGEPSGPERKATPPGPIMRSVDAIVTDYDRYTKSVGEVLRPLAFGAIATIWVLADQKFDAIVGQLRWATLSVILALGFDLLQYSTGGWFYGFLIWLAERQGKKKSDEMPFPLWPRSLIRIAYHLKIIALLMAWGFLLAAAIAYTPPKVPPL